jgi:hypothetical protein
MQFHREEDNIRIHLKDMEGEKIGWLLLSRLVTYSRKLLMYDILARSELFSPRLL